MLQRRARLRFPAATRDVKRPFASPWIFFVYRENSGQSVEFEPDVDDLSRASGLWRIVAPAVKLRLPPAIEWPSDQGRKYRWPLVLAEPIRLVLRTNRRGQ